MGGRVVFSLSLGVFVFEKRKEVMVMAGMYNTTILFFITYLCRYVYGMGYGTIDRVYGT